MVNNSLERKRVVGVIEGKRRMMYKVGEQALWCEIEEMILCHICMYEVHSKSN